MSWYALLAGVGLFPDADQLHPPTADEARHSLAAIDNLLERSALNFPDHRELLKSIPAKSRERSLQLYLW
jgi:tryptophan 6-halogenase